jgi:hypothetical protein
MRDVLHREVVARGHPQLGCIDLRPDTFAAATAGFAAMQAEKVLCNV